MRTVYVEKEYEESHIEDVFDIRAKVSKWRRGCSLPHEKPETWEEANKNFGRVILRVKI